MSLEAKFSSKKFLKKFTLITTNFFIVGHAMWSGFQTDKAMQYYHLCLHQFSHLTVPGIMSALTKFMF